MAKQDKIREWANAGTIETPDTSKQNLGWGASEQVAFEYWNHLENKQDVNINRAYQELNERGTQSPSCPNFDFISEFNHGSRDWSNLSSERNRFTISGGVINMCRGWSFSRNQEVVWAIDVDSPSSILQLYNDKTDSGNYEVEGDFYSVTLDNLSDTFTDICCDGDYVYLLAYSDVPITNVAKVYKMNANPWSSTPVWVRNFNTLTLDPNIIGENRLIVADANNLALLFRGSATVAQNPIGILKKDNSGFSTGLGNAPSSSTLVPGTGLCTDGTSVFFTIENPASLVNGQFCAADISNPAAAVGMTAQDYGITSKVGGIVFDGEHVVFVPWMGNDAKIHIYRRGTNTLRATNIINGGIYYDAADRRFPVVFDGMRIWCLMNFHGDSNDYNGFVTAWYPYLHNDLPNPGNYPEYYGVKHFLAEETEDLAGSVITHAKMVFADGCMWISPRVDDPVTQPQIIRMPNVLGRF